MVGDLFAEGQHLSAIGELRVDRPTLAVGVRPRLAGGEPEAASAQRLGQQRPHGGDLVIGGDLGVTLVAHDLAAQGTVSDQESGVDAQIPIEAVKVLTEGLPVPRDAFLQGDEGHSFHLGHHAADVARIVRGDRGEGEATVAADDRRDAMEVRRRGRRVPEELGVVVGVGVDHPGHDHQSGSIKLHRPLLVDGAQGGDPPVANPDVGGESGGAGPIDHGGVPDDVVEHLGPRSLGGAKKI